MDLVYNTPQDQLLVMLLERISKLEDIVENNNKLTSQLLSLVTYKYFTLSITGKLVNKRYSIIPKDYVLEIINYINESVPIIKAWATFYPDETGCSITVETQYDQLPTVIKETFKNLHEDMVVNSTGWREFKELPAYSTLFAIKNRENNKMIIV
jgi:hypothetical protein